MGKRKARVLNPTDAFRKVERDKEKKRNRKERARVREEAMLHKNPNDIKMEISSLRRKAALGHVDNSGRKRLERLEAMWTRLQPKMKELYSSRLAEEAERRQQEVAEGVGATAATQPGHASQDAVRASDRRRGSGSLSSNSGFSTSSSGTSESDGDSDGSSSSDSASDASDGSGNQSFTVRCGDTGAVQKRPRNLSASGARSPEATSTGVRNVSYDPVGTDGASVNIYLEEKSGQEAAVSSTMAGGGRWDIAAAAATDTPTGQPIPRTEEEMSRGASQYFSSGEPSGVGTTAATSMWSTAGFPFPFMFPPHLLPAVQQAAQSGGVMPFPPVGGGSTPTQSAGSNAFLSTNAGESGLGGNVPTPFAGSSKGIGNDSGISRLAAPPRLEEYAGQCNPSGHVPPTPNLGSHQPSGLGLPPPGSSNAVMVPGTVWPGLPKFGNPVHLRHPDSMRQPVLQLGTEQQPTGDNPITPLDPIPPDESFCFARNASLVLPSSFTVISRRNGLQASDNQNVSHELPVGAAAQEPPESSGSSSENGGVRAQHGLADHSSDSTLQGLQPAFESTRGPLAPPGLDFVFNSFSVNPESAASSAVPGILKTDISSKRHGPDAASSRVAFPSFRLIPPGGAVTTDGSKLTSPAPQRADGGPGPVSPPWPTDDGKEGDRRGAEINGGNGSESSNPPTPLQCQFPAWQEHGGAQGGCLGESMVPGSAAVMGHCNFILPGATRTQAAGPGMGSLAAPPTPGAGMISSGIGCGTLPFGSVPGQEWLDSPLQSSRYGPTPPYYASMAGFPMYLGPPLRGALPGSAAGGAVPAGYPAVNPSTGVSLFRTTSSVVPAAANFHGAIPGAEATTGLSQEAPKETTQRSPQPPANAARRAPTMFIPTLLRSQNRAAAAKAATSRASQLSSTLLKSRAVARTAAGAVGATAATASLGGSSRDTTGAAASSSITPRVPITRPAKPRATAESLDKAFEAFMRQVTESEDIL